MNKRDLNVLGISTSELMGAVNYYRSNGLKESLITAEEMLNARLNLIADLGINQRTTCTDDRQFKIVHLNGESFSVTHY